MPTRDFALLYINGKRHEVRGDAAGLMLADYLRYEAGLTGTKIVCAEGDCGACSVLRWFPYPTKKNQPAPFEAINSCIATVAQLDGSSLVTVEGCGTPAAMNPVQSAMVKCHGSQCGFCTPGFVVALTGLAERRCAEQDRGPIPQKTAQNYLTGNLCRCTGYRPILDAAAAIDLTKYQSLAETCLTPKIKKELTAAVKVPVEIRTEDFHFFAPVTVKAASQFRAKQPGALIMGAATDLGVLSNKNKLKLAQLLSLHLVAELYESGPVRGAKANRFRVGARVTLSTLRRDLEKRAPEIARFLDLFASPQIKNAATLVGNVANASPIGDTPPFLLSTNAVLTIYGAKKRTLPLHEFYLGYRKTALKKGEWIGAIEFDLPSATDTFALYKNSQRKDLDISCVSGAFRLERKGNALAEVRLAMGGVAATPVRLIKTEAYLRGKELSASVIEQAAVVAQGEIKPLSDLRGSSAYRRIVAEGLLLNFLRSAEAAT
jgi:xanthine dehydrogenase small subunit